MSPYPERAPLESSSKSRPNTLADQLDAAGWIEALIPGIPVGAKLSPGSTVRPEDAGKIPGDLGPYGWRGLSGWQNFPTTRNDVARWLRNGATLGARSGSLLTIFDIDCDYIAVTRRLVAEHEAAYGPTLQRWRGPRVALFYRTDGPSSPKRIIDFTDPTTGTVVFKEEILGKGQQAIVGPLKHKSGSYYLDQHGEHFVAAMIARPVSSLPAVSASQVESHPSTLSIAQRVAREYGLTATLRIERTASDRQQIDQAELLCPWPIEQLAALVKQIPNNCEMTGDRLAYLTMGYALRAASGTEHATDALEMFQEWASRWEGPYDATVTALDFKRMHGPFAVGFDWLCGKARDAGVIVPGGAEFKPIEVIS